MGRRAYFLTHMSIKDEGGQILDLGFFINYKTDFKPTSGSMNMLVDIEQVTFIVNGVDKIQIAVKASKQSSYNIDTYNPIGLYASPDILESG